MKLLIVLFAILAIVFASDAPSDVVDLTPENFDTVLSNGPAFVEFYAPWCGHCKTLAPEFDKVATAFKKAGGKVTIAKVDADKHKSLGTRFDVKGFPTLFYFPNGPEQKTAFSGDRTAEGIVSWINKEAGTYAKIVKPPSFVTELTADNFDKIIQDSSKSILVEFFAPWCGHCKRLAPIWEEVAGIFSGEKKVVIAKMDCDAAGNNAICSKYDVTGYPTLKWFQNGRKSDKDNEAFNGERTTVGIVDFVNERAGTKRLTSGLLKEDVGRLSFFDDLVKKLVGGDSSAVKTAEEKAKELTGDDKEYANIYVRFMKVYQKKGSSFPSDEKARLTRLVDGKGMKKDKIDEFTVKINILSSFL